MRKRRAEKKGMIGKGMIGGHFSHKDNAADAAEQALSALCAVLKERHGYSDEEINRIISAGVGTRTERGAEILLPISIFKSRRSCLESICLYLKQMKKLSLTNSARRISRSPKTIWAAYHRATRKSEKFAHDETDISVPLSIFADRSLSALEALVTHLHTERMLRFCEIAKLLLRDQRTIWATYSNARRKRAKGDAKQTE